MALAEYGEELSDEMADELDSVEAGFEEAADEAGLTPEEVSEAQEALEAAARGEVPPAEMEKAMAALEAIASGEMTVAEAAAEEMALGFLGPLINMAGPLLKSTIGPSVISGAKNFLGKLLGKKNVRRFGKFLPRQLPGIPQFKGMFRGLESSPPPVGGIKAGLYRITPVSRSKLTRKL